MARTKPLEANQGHLADGVVAPQALTAPSAPLSLHAAKVAPRRPFPTGSSASCRTASFTKTVKVNREPALSLAWVRISALDPRLLPAASAWARRFHPRTTLARAA